MLSPDFIYTDVPERLVGVYREIEDDMLRDLARRLEATRASWAAGEISATAVWEVKKAQDLGILYKDLRATVAKYARVTEDAVEATMLNAGIQSAAYDNAIYERAAQRGSIASSVMTPAELADYISEKMSASIVTANNAMRLTNTRAIEGATHAFSNAVDKAYLEVQFGTKTFDKALKGAADRLAAQGIQVIGYASGRKIGMEAAVRANMITAANQSCARLAEHHMATMGVELVETTSHAGARPDHAAWQGKVFTYGAPSDKYEDLVAATGYGTAGGLCGVNCRHSFYPFIEGVSTRSFKRDPAEKYLGINNDELYKLTQRQRAMERNIRKAKRQQEMAEALGDDADITAARSRVRKRQAELRDFLDDHDTVLARDRIREQIGKGGSSYTRKPSVPRAPLSGVGTAGDQFTARAGEIAQEASAAVSRTARSQGVKKELAAAPSMGGN